VRRTEPVERLPGIDGLETAGDEEAAATEDATAAAAPKAATGDGHSHEHVPAGRDGASGSDGSSDERSASPASPSADGKALVVTRRFKPRGDVELETVPLTTRYGKLEIAASDILQISFGPAKTGDSED